ncbi:MAG: HD domain-containing protein [Pirellulales bacterium]|nr:HD domain-containing protein [Pirellulales bacterium]
MGLTCYAGWLKTRLRQTIHDQVVADNIQTAQQLARLVREIGLQDFRSPSSWERMQSIVEDIRLPNEGFVCVVDSESGELLCHPEMRRNPGLRDVAIGLSELSVDGVKSTVIEATRQKIGTAVGGIAMIGGETHVLAAAHLPDIASDVLVHQRQSGIEHAVNRIITPTKRLGYVVALAVTLVVTIVNLLIVRGYENKLARINENLEDLVRQRTRALTKTRNAVIFGLAKLAESRDTDTGHHLERIRSYVMVLAKELQRWHPELNDALIEDMALASSLHDIGKVGIPDRVLLKPGRFTVEERQTMERHAELGGDCLKAVQRQLGDDDFLQLSTEIAYYHHERWDGSGYPFGKSNQGIPLSARIVALADVYDALTSKRPYKDAMSHEKARNIILEGCETHFDPEVVEAFLSMEDDFRQIAAAGQAHAESLSPPGQFEGEPGQPQTELQPTLVS